MENIMKLNEKKKKNKLIFHDRYGMAKHCTS